MDSYAVEELVQERQAEIRRLRGLDRPGPGMWAWRRRAGRALVALAVSVGVPRSHRRTARCRLGALLGLDPFP